MATYVTPPPEGVAPVSVKRISWASVFAGVVLAVAIQLLFSMLGTGIGMSTVDPAQGASPPAKAFGISAGLWWTVSSLIALFLGGWIAAYLAGVPSRVDGMLHGLLTWGLATLLTLYLVGAAVSSLLGGLFTMGRTGVSAVAPQAAQVAKEKIQESDLSWENIKQEVQKLLRQTDKPALQPQAFEKSAKKGADAAAESAKQAAKQPQAADQELEALFERLIRKAKASAADKEGAVNVLVARGMSREEATRTIENWQRAYQEARAAAEKQAREAAQAAAQATAQTALWGFFALLLGAIAAAVGGMAGRPKISEENLR
jgi:hypothetical protein